MGYFRIEEGGFLSTIQDAGRHGYRNWGMPLSGAMDSCSFMAANIITGNSPDEAVIEITLTGPTIRFCCRAMIAITGAEMNPMINGTPAEMWKSLIIGRGDILTFGRLDSGVRCYLAVAGGLGIPAVMGSRSTYLRGAIGGLEGRKLSAGDKIPVKPYAWLLRKRRKTPLGMIPEWRRDPLIMITEGRDYTSFTEESRERLINSGYIVTPYFDRMGIRIKGHPLVHTSGKADVISYPLAGGTIQVPGDGQPVIMVSDSQTIGGYSQIANIITADLFKTGQIKGGDVIRFRLVDIKEAVERLRQQREEIYCFQKR